MKSNIYSKRRYKLLCLGVVGIILVTATVGGALALPTCVYALPPALLRARTIGELIITILAGANTAVTATPTVTGIYQACPFTYEEMVTNGVLSVEGMTTQEALDNLGQGTQIGRAYELDTTAFRNLMSQNWQTMIDNNMDTVFRVGNIANTDSTYGAIDNIGQIVQNVANNGYLALENTVAIIANPGTAVTVTLDNIRQAMQNVFQNNINNSAPTNYEIVGDAPGGYNFNGMIYTNRNPTYSYYKPYYFPSNTAKFVLKTGTRSYEEWDLNVNNQNVTIYNKGTQQITDGEITAFPISQMSTGTRNANSYYRSSTGTYQSDIIDFQVFGRNTFMFFNKADMDAFAQQCIDNATVPSKPTPDIITEQGNISPEIAPTNEPAIQQGEGLEIIPQTTYNNFIDTVNNNNTINNYYGNGEELQDLINDNIYTEPQPTQPPIVPDQPTIDPKPSIAPEMQQQVLSGTTPNLATKFPFCIPFDLVNSFKVLEKEAKAPHIEWNFKVDRFDIDEKIEIDLTDFTPVAEILRILILLSYIIGLILLTRSLIGA